MHKHREHFGYLVPNRLVMEVAEVLTKELMPSYEKGHTFDPRLLEIPAFPRSAYTVALEGHGLPFSKIPSVEKVARWLSYQTLLLCRSGNYIGYWYDDENDEYCLDVSIIVRGRQNALKLARQYKQRYIFHPFTNTPIPVNPSNNVKATEFNFDPIPNLKGDEEMPITHQTYLNQLWDGLKFAVRLPLIALLIAISIMFSCMGILFVAKLFGFVFQQFITTPW